MAQPSPAATGPIDGLRVVFCGTSGPLPIVGRAKPCVAVQAGDNLYLVDVGPEATENLMLWRMPVATAKAVFLTHMHSDHIGDVGEFNLQSWVAGRPARAGPGGSAGRREGRGGLQPGLRTRPRLSQGAPRARRLQVLYRRRPAAAEDRARAEGRPVGRRHGSRPKDLRSRPRSWIV